MPNPSLHTIHLFSAPRRVYAAADGVFPQWRFLVVALNLTAEAATLAQVTQVTGAAPPTAADDRIGLWQTPPGPRRPLPPVPPPVPLHPLSCRSCPLTPGP